MRWVSEAMEWVPRHEGVARSPGPGLSRISLVQRMRWDGTVMNDVGTFPAEMLQFAFQNVASVGISGESIYAGDGLASEYRVYPPAGKLVRIVRWNDPPTRITGDMIDEAVRATIPTNVTGVERTQRIEQGRARPYPAPLPAYFGLVSDGSGRIWVRDYHMSPQPHGWTVFDRSGRLLGRVVPPPLPTERGRVEIAKFDRDQVVLRWRDADGAAHLSFHTLVPVR